jgi:hypothetical protein
MPQQARVENAKAMASQVTEYTKQVKINHTHHQGQPTPTQTPTTGRQTPNTSNGNLWKAKYQPGEHPGKKRKVLETTSATAKDKAKGQRQKEQGIKPAELAKTPYIPKGRAVYMEPDHTLYKKMSTNGHGYTKEQGISCINRNPPFPEETISSYTTLNTMKPDSKRTCSTSAPTTTATSVVSIRSGHFGFLLLSQSFSLILMTASGFMY